jgi:hypothetical protein
MSDGSSSSGRLSAVGGPTGLKVVPAGNGGAIAITRRGGGAAGTDSGAHVRKS